MQLGEIAKVSQHGANTNVMLRARDAKKLALAKREVEEMLERAASTIKERLRSDYESGGQEFESLRARQLAHCLHNCFVQCVCGAVSTVGASWKRGGSKNDLCSRPR